MPSVQALRAVVGAQPELELAVWFGSTARGRGGRHSDLDLGVRLFSASEGARLALGQALSAALFPATLDLVFLERAPPLLRMEIARHGRLLLERRPHAWANFRAQAMIDWADYGPVARAQWQAALRRLRDEVAHGCA